MSRKIFLHSKRLANLFHVANESGVIRSTTLDMGWQRSPLPLPSFCRLTIYKTPEPNHISRMTCLMQQRYRHLVDPYWLVVQPIQYPSKLELYLNACHSGLGDRAAFLHQWSIPPGEGEDEIGKEDEGNVRGSLINFVF